MTSRSLVRLAHDAEDAASGLLIFKDSPDLAPSATRITAAISECFAVSAGLRELDAAQAAPRSAAAFFAIRQDVELVSSTIRRTLDDVSAMFRKSARDSHQRCWEDLTFKMNDEELAGLLERLRWYRDFLRDLDSSLSGRLPDTLAPARRRLRTLLDAQEMSKARSAPLLIDQSATSTPRPRAPRRPSARIVEPSLSPTTLSDYWDYDQPPPVAPEPPEPLSPTFTTSSSQSLPSSHTSYSNGTYDHRPSNPIHWAQEVFDGQYPTTPFKSSHRLDDRSQCYGTLDLSSLSRLRDDGFARVLELPFDRESVWVRLYWRPADGRARILFITKDSRRHDQHYCIPLTTLKVIRNRSCLQLCRAHRDGRYILWCRLNFVSFEKMVLFYSTFVSMKMQDGRGIDHDKLVDDLELNEEIEYAGQITDGNLLHCLRLFRDKSSGVVRLEASALRGPMQGAPLWTAFMTKYLDDVYNVQLEDRITGIVTIAALRPPPYAFLPDYGPPITDGGYELAFTTRQDAEGFVFTWTALCRAA